MSLDNPASRGVHGADAARVCRVGAHVPHPVASVSGDRAGDFYIDDFMIQLSLSDDEISYKLY